MYYGYDEWGEEECGGSGCDCNLLSIPRIVVAIFALVIVVVAAADTLNVFTGHGTRRKIPKTVFAVLLKFIVILHIPSPIGICITLAINERRYCARDSIAVHRSTCRCHDFVFHLSSNK